MRPSYVGNVHEVYDISEGNSIIVSTDRLSVHGKVIPWEIENKGIILTQISNFWFSYTEDIIQNHIIETNVSKMPDFFRSKKFERRTVMVQKLKIIPYEFIVHGYMYGRIWKEYKKTQNKMKIAEKLDFPLLTVTRKLDHNRDVDVDLEEVKRDLGEKKFYSISDACIKLYDRCNKFALGKGLIIADTKFEFGLTINDKIVLADEIFTPDSSRFWDLENYTVGKIPKSFDKQLIRDWLSNHKENNQYQFDKIPYQLVLETQNRYSECYDRLLN